MLHLSDENRIQKNALIILESILLFFIHYYVFSQAFWQDFLPIGIDGFYHYTVSSLHGLGNLAQDIDFLPYTYLGENQTNHHWLFHLFVKPLTFINESSPYEIKNATIIWASMLPSLLNVVLRLQGIAHAPLVSCLAIWSLDYLPDRYLMFRAQNLAVIFLIAIQFLAVRKSYLGLALAIFLFNHAYQAVVVVGLGILALVIAEYYANKKIDKKLFLYAVGGFGASLILSPWFPNNIEFLIFHILFKLSNDFAAYGLEGTEWAALGLAGVAKHCTIGLVATFISTSILWMNREKREGSRAFILALAMTLLAVFTLFMCTVHMRMVEVAGPISIVALAVALPLINLEEKKKAISMLALYVMLLVVSISVFSSGLLRHEIPMERVANHCRYLDSEYKDGELVFNAANWSTFSYFIKCVPRAKFVAGLDGNMLAYGDRDVFTVWYYLFAGKIDVEKLSEQDLNGIINVLVRVKARHFFLVPTQKESIKFILDNIPYTEVKVIDDFGVIIRFEYEKTTTK